MTRVGGMPDDSSPPVERASATLAWLKRTLLDLPDSHESAIEIDKHEILQRIDMVAMTVAAVRHRGPRPDLLLSVQKDALFALEAATDAHARAGWDLGRQAAGTLMLAASMLAAMPGMLAAP